MSSIETRYGPREESQEKLANLWKKATDNENFAGTDKTDLSLLETSFLQLEKNDREKEQDENIDKKQILFVARDPGGIRRVLPIIEDLTQREDVEIFGWFDNFAKEEFFNNFANDKYKITDHTDRELKSKEDFNPDYVFGCRSASGGEKYRQSLILSAMTTFQDSARFLYGDAYNTPIETILELKKREVPLPEYVGVQTLEEVRNIERALENVDTKTPNYRYFVEDQCIIGDIPPVKTLPLVIRGLVPGASSTTEVKDIIQSWFNNPQSLRYQREKAEKARQSLQKSSFEEIINSLLDDDSNKVETLSSDTPLRIVEIGEVGKERLKKMDIGEKRAQSRRKLVELYKDYGFNDESKLITYVSTDVANYESEIAPQIYSQIKNILNKAEYDKEDIEYLVSNSKKFEKIFRFAKDLASLETNEEKIFFIFRQHPRDKETPFEVYEAIFNQAFQSSKLSMLPNTAKDNLNTSEVVQASTVSITTWSGMLGEMAVTGPAIAWIDATKENGASEKPN
jgi:hypothetical protein